MRTTFVLVWIVCLLILSGESHRASSQPMSDNNPEDTQSIRCPAPLRAQPELSNTPVFTSGVANPLFSSPFYLVTIRMPWQHALAIAFWYGMTSSPPFKRRNMFRRHKAHFITWGFGITLKTTI